MKNYCLYYIPKSEDKISDMLMIYFGEYLPVTNRLDKEDISILFNKETVVGYLLHNFSSIAKIKINGTVFAPNNFLVDVINSVLTNHQLETLDYKNSSGIFVGVITSKRNRNKTFVYRVDIGNVISVESTFEIPVGTYVVVATNNTYLLPARMITKYRLDKDEVNEGRICTYEDLQMDVENASTPVMLLDGIIGEDFFMVEEKVNA